MNTQIQEYSATEAGLQELRQRMQGIVYEVTTTAGMKQAKEDRRELVSLRTSLEAMRKEIKAPALERCKLIDTEAKRITGEILQLEKPIDEQIKAEEARKAEEKAERERIEKERVDGIRRMIEKIKDYPFMAIDLTATRLAEVLPGVEALEIKEDEYQEFMAEAQYALMESVSKLKQMLSEKQAVEAEAARVRAEQEAEAARLKAEREESERKAAEEREKLEAERAKLEAERKEQERIRAEEERRIREAREAEEVKLKAEREAEEKRLREIREKEEAEFKAKREEEEKRMAEERRKLEEVAAAKQAEIDRQQRELEEARAKSERMVTCPKCGHEFDPKAEEREAA